MEDEMSLTPSIKVIRRRRKSNSQFPFSVPISHLAILVESLGHFEIG